MLPRISFSAISETYCGAETQNAPPANPRKNLPTNMIAKFCAHATKPHPSVNRITSTIIVHLRPNFFIKNPTGKHETAHPIVKIEATKLNAFSSILKLPSSSSTNLGPRRDGQPRATPTAKEPPVCCLSRNSLWPLDGCLKH